MAKALMALVATHVAAAAVGYQMAPREMLDEMVEQTGFFSSDTKRILSATVASLRDENKLLVWSFRGDARVKVSRSEYGGLLHGEQELIVPASVDYFLDLSEVTLAQIEYDSIGDVVTVHLPPLKLGDVKFQPEAARTINGGLLTFDQDQVDEFTKLNYEAARRAFTKQAQGATLVEAAKRQAKRDIARVFLIPLRAAGNSNAKIVTVY